MRGALWGQAHIASLVRVDRQGACTCSACCIMMMLSGCRLILLGCAQPRAGAAEVSHACPLNPEAWPANASICSSSGMTTVKR